MYINLDLWYFWENINSSNLTIICANIKFILSVFQRLIAKDIALYMSEGHWFISLYNDFGDSQDVEFFATMSLEMTEGCPMGCNGHGECVLGRCKCETGYGGDDCSEGKII